MNRKQLKFCLIGAVILFGGCTASDPTNHLDSSADTLFQIKPDQNRAALERQSGTDQYLKLLLNVAEDAEVKEVQVKPGLVSKGTTMLSMPLTDGRTVSFKLSRSDNVASGMVGWVGDMPSNRRQLYPSPAEIDMDPLNWVSLVSDGNLVVGDIRVEGQLYRLTAVGKGQQVLVKVDETKLPPEAAPIAVPVQPQGNTPSLTAPLSSKSKIRVLFVTTRQSRALYPNYGLELILALLKANLYLSNSNVEALYELGGFYDSDYDETGKEPQAQLNDMMADKPLGAAIHIEREKARADLVSMLSTYSIYCGIAKMPARKETAFSSISCFGALGHELGHNMGAMHSDESPVQGIPAYAYGYKHTAPNFHTQMRTSHGAIPYHSNPRLQYEGVPIGTVDKNDVARTFNERREVVENFYPTLRMQVFTDLNFQGDMCAMSLESGVGKPPCDQPKSAKVFNFVPGMRLCFRSENYKEVCYGGSFAGSFEVPDLKAAGALPSGLYREGKVGDDAFNGDVQHVEYKNDYMLTIQLHSLPDHQGASCEFRLGRGSGGSLSDWPQCAALSDGKSRSAKVFAFGGGDSKLCFYNADFVQSLCFTGAYQGNFSIKNWDEGSGLPAGLVRTPGGGGSMNGSVHHSFYGFGPARRPPAP
ncbi:TPA: zinc-dependent metalloprotease family protein [Pseudomonas putida]|uniref:Zinc-dependent metalloprotease family protein n=3 Tax=Pseudomonas putida TaxID=303 RepID=A0AAW6PWI1_PSEPU|nr:zinc-dependent metalloprotease family protein [Pseudomonas putida]MDN5674447.1 metallopeptidase [Pseudomonas sp.]MCE0959779.1 metallopeptidase [Pseudomonas putida]MDD2119263.1 metallopeptidase [Pseudomonas putida]MDF3874213.1 zinc-dependent metalloprotease family protein [Pseudomonas putida]MDF3874899.1 zinc-dependent metalloprotease family protein [Pseudomonas putida]